MPSLEALRLAGFDIAAVVTNPDRPSGRGMKQTASPVKEKALDMGVPVLQPEKARDPGFHEQLVELAPEVAVVVAYGKILPGALLEVPRRGFVNVHFSLLPEYRGAAPVQRAVIDGKSTTGVSLMVLTEGMDEGPVLAEHELDIAPDETAGELGDRLAEVGAGILPATLTSYVDGSLVPVEQDHDRATYAPKIAPEEGRIDWTLPSGRIHDLVRGLNPAPGAWTTLDGERLKVHATRTSDVSLEPGELAKEDLLVAGTGDGALELVEVQLAGRKRMSGPELARGLKPTAGLRPLER